MNPGKAGIFGKNGKKITAQINCCFELLLVFFLPTYHYAARSKQACRPGAEETSFKVVCA
jgi:hypothetical protein